MKCLDLFIPCKHSQKIRVLKAEFTGCLFVLCFTLGVGKILSLLEFLSVSSRSISHLSIFYIRANFLFS